MMNDTSDPIRMTFTYLERHFRIIG